VETRRPAQPSFRLRLLTTADQPLLWQMLYQAIFVPPGQEAPPFAIVTQSELARYVAAWGRAEDLGFVAEDAETRQPVGAAWIRLLAGEECGYGYVDARTPELSIAVLPDYRGMGVGTALLTALLDAAAERFPAVSLSVSRDNPAHRLYTRFGFTVVADDGESLTMVRPLQRFCSGRDKRV
jgi:GNAT superfamily N-acetyltransferase